MWDFASEVSSADAKSERLLYAFIYLFIIWYETGDTNTKSRRLFEIVFKKWVILMENPSICCSRWAGMLLIKNVRICFWNKWEFVLKSEYLFSIWYLTYPLSYPLLVVFYGIKWKMENESKIGRKLFEFRVVFEWNSNGI